MQEEKIRQILETVNTGGQPMPENKVEEVISMFREADKTEYPAKRFLISEEEHKRNQESELRVGLSKETDWKERLKIMARIISLGLE